MQVLRHIRTALLCSGILLVLASPAVAQAQKKGFVDLVRGFGTMNLRWNPVAGAQGYRVYYGVESGRYTSVIDVGFVTETTLEQLGECIFVYVAVKAYNAQGESTDFSNEISGWSRPTIDRNDTEIVMQGDMYTINLVGSNFQPGAEVVFEQTDAEGNPLIHVESAQVVSCFEIQALVSVEPKVRGFRAMEVGRHNFKVRNPDHTVGYREFEVMLDPERLDINRSDGATRDRVDGKDLVWLAYAHGTGDGENRYNPDADVNGDGVVDGEDLAHLATRYGACWDGNEWSKENCP